MAKQLKRHQNDRKRQLSHTRHLVISHSTITVIKAAYFSEVYCHVSIYGLKVIVASVA
jgi:hypothetical protein